MRLFGIETVYGRDGVYDTPYLTRIKLGRLSVHIFHRGDNDPDCHNHVREFWTFPLTTYLEEVRDGDSSFWRVVDAFRLHYRSADYTHRIISRCAVSCSRNECGVSCRPGKIITVVWWGRAVERPWGFWVNGQFVHWRTYIFGEHNHG